MIHSSFYVLRASKVPHNDDRTSDHSSHPQGALVGTLVSEPTGGHQ